MDHLVKSKEKIKSWGQPRLWSSGPFDKVEQVQRCCHLGTHLRRVGFFLLPTKILGPEHVTTLPIKGCDQWSYSPEAVLRANEISRDPEGSANKFPFPDTPSYERCLISALPWGGYAMHPQWTVNKQFCLSHQELPQGAWRKSWST